MRKIFNFGKIAYYGNRKINKVTVEVELKQNDKGQYIFSACGNVWNSENTDIIMGGQCLDDLKKYLFLNNTFNLIYKMWKKYHLNDMHAGTEEQEKALTDAGMYKDYDYTKACDYLKSINLYEVDYNGAPYKYGHGWLLFEIPSEDIETIKKLLVMED